jgi:hypothetical protein
VLAVIVIKTGRSIYSANSYCDNNGEGSICSTNSYCDNNDNNGEVYM